MKRAAVAALLFVLGAWSIAAFAADTQPYDKAKFEAAQKANRPILVDIKASWCPTCAAQEPILEKLAARPEFKSLAIFTVDFDTQKPVVRAFGARSQSTLIAFRGGKETARSVGDTDPDSIGTLLRTTLQ